jgi:hypothetical protein
MKAAVYDVEGAPGVLKYVDVPGSGHRARRHSDFCRGYLD